MEPSDQPFFDVGAIEQRIQRNLSRAMFAARWIMAPIYVGLLAALIFINLDQHATPRVQSVSSGLSPRLIQLNDLRRSLLIR